MHVGDLCISEILCGELIVGGCVKSEKPAAEFAAGRWWWWGWSQLPLDLLANITIKLFSLGPWLSFPLEQQRI